MASEQQVKRYLAYWFQLGKKVVNPNGEPMLPQSVIEGDRYSEQFESLWQQILSSDSSVCYLEGTQQTIAELLTPKWEVTSCFRCEMPVPMIKIGLPPEFCPCHDLPTWPNTELPAPREPISSQNRLTQIRNRLSRPTSN